MVEARMKELELTDVITAFLVAGLLAGHGLRGKSLSKSGAIAAFAVGFLTFLVSRRLGFVMIAFYKSSSMWTKFGREKKVKMADDYREAGERSAAQVLSCSLLGTCLALYGWLVLGVRDQLVDFRADFGGSALLCAYLAFYACCNGDTWASEVGVLSRSPPRLITRPFTRVPAGTNGGISALGTLASVAGGAFIGLAFWLLGMAQRFEPPPGAVGPAPPQSRLICLGAASGLVGSVVDSAMGAVLQATYYDEEKKRIVARATKAEVSSGKVRWVSGFDLLTNQQINFYSAAVTSVAAGLLSWRLFPS